MTTGMEDRLFGAGELRRMRVLRIFRNYDVDPNMHPDGSFEEGRLERLISDPTISFDNIRRSAQMTARNGFTSKEIAAQYPHHLPITMSDPNKFLDTSFGFDGEQEFTDGGVRMADVSRFEPGEDDLMETLMREAEPDEAFPIDEESEMSPSEQMLNPEVTSPISTPEEQGIQGEVVADGEVV